MLKLVFERIKHNDDFWRFGNLFGFSCTLIYLSATLHLMKTGKSLLKQVTSQQLHSEYIGIISIWLFGIWFGTKCHTLVPVP